MVSNNKFNAHCAIFMRHRFHSSLYGHYLKKISMIGVSLIAENDVYDLLNFFTPLLIINGKISRFFTVQMHSNQLT